MYANKFDKETVRSMVLDYVCVSTDEEILQKLENYANNAYIKDFVNNATLSELAEMFGIIHKVHAVSIDRDTEQVIAEWI